MAAVGHHLTTSTGSSSNAGNGSVHAWLQWLQGEAQSRLVECRQEEQRLEQVWQHVVARADRVRPEELQQLVDERLKAAADTASAETAVEVAEAAAEHVSQHDAAPIPLPSLDATVLRRLLDGIAVDRSATTVAVVRDALEMLCSLALDLEVTERAIGSGTDVPTHALVDLRTHVTEAASRLRALPAPGAGLIEPSEQVAFVVRRVVSAYAGSLEISFAWHGGEPSSRDSGTALLWALQELVHHLHSTLGARCEVVVHTDHSGSTLTVSTPSWAFADVGDEADWLMRTRLRVGLAGGTVECTAEESSSRVTVRLP